MKFTGDPSSKYFFNPGKLDEDIKKNQEKIRQRRKIIYEILIELINLDTFQKENYNLLIEELIKIKIENEFY
ncbi:hypothetical protein [Clostridium akagii]|uniref:hypothetical protein n=1 Tax=Clostridium akagii TaxID=91623 RepID=UPI000478F789|nr:hypothetical protein [Clostridium akagii]